MDAGRGARTAEPRRASVGRRGVAGARRWSQPCHDPGSPTIQLAVSGRRLEGGWRVIGHYEGFLATRPQNWLELGARAFKSPRCGPSDRDPSRIRGSPDTPLPHKPSRRREGRRRRANHHHPGARASRFVRRPGRKAGDCRAVGGVPPRGRARVREALGGPGGRFCDRRVTSACAPVAPGAPSHHSGGLRRGGLARNWSIRRIPRHTPRRPAPTGQGLGEKLITTVDFSPHPRAPARRAAPPEPTEGLAPYAAVETAAGTTSANLTVSMNCRKRASLPSRMSQTWTTGTSSALPVALPVPV